MARPRLAVKVDRGAELCVVDVLVGVLAHASLSAAWLWMWAADTGVGRVAEVESDLQGVRASRSQRACHLTSSLIILPFSLGLTQLGKKPPRHPIPAVAQALLFLGHHPLCPDMPEQHDNKREGTNG